jgi:hypothetical protein
MSAIGVFFLLLTLMTCVLGAEVTLVDHDVPQVEEFRYGANSVLVRLARGENLASVLRSRGLYNVSALHIVSHGSAGIVSLGELALDATSSSVAQLAVWRRHLAQDAVVLLYACSAGRGSKGRALVRRVAELTGATVAASRDVTGHAELGGNWKLEEVHGPNRRVAQEAAARFSKRFAFSWRHVLQFLTVTPISWDVVGLDSNNVNVGPNLFLIGARVCAAQASTAVMATLVWDTPNSFINLSPGSPSVLPVSPSVVNLAAGACFDFYFNVAITRTSLAYTTTRKYRVLVTAANQWTIQTPNDRQLYVEQILSQNRNTVVSFTGSTAVTVGGTYTYDLVAKTAPGGYNSVTNFPFFPNTVFQVLSITTTYTNPAGGTNNGIWANACGYEESITSPNYRSCVGPCQYAGCGAGGTITSEYVVKILGGAGSTVAVSNLITDFSGSSYHYNADFGSGINILNIVVSAAINPVTASKSLSPASIKLGAAGAGTATISVNNSNAVNLTGVSFSDPFPAGLTLVGTPTGSPAACGTPTIVNNVLSVSGGTVGASGVCTYTATYTGTSAGTLTNPKFDILNNGGSVGTVAAAPTIVMLAPAVDKVFGMPTVAVSSTTQTVTITIANNNPAAIQNIKFNDTLSPAVASLSQISSTCGVTAVFAAGPPSTISYTTTGLNLAANSACTITGTIGVGATAQAYVNAPFNVTSDNAPDAATVQRQFVATVAQSLQRALCESILFIFSNLFFSVQDVPKCDTGCWADDSGHDCVAEPGLGRRHNSGSFQLFRHAAGWIALNWICDHYGGQRRDDRVSKSHFSRTHLHEHHFVSMRNCRGQ